MIRMLALIALVSIAGCSTGGTPYVAMTEPNNQQALVHIYRPNKISMREKKAYFFVDGKPFTTLKNNGYAASYFAPGSYTIRQTWSPSPDDNPVAIRVTFEPGRTYYLRLNPNLTPETRYTYFYWELQDVGKALGGYEITLSRHEEIESFRVHQ